MGYAQNADHFNLDKMIEFNRQNSKAFTEAARISAEGAQAIAKFQAEIFQRHAEEIAKFFQSLASANSSDSAVEQLTNAVKSNSEYVAKNSKGILDAATKSANDAASIINKRVATVINESREATVANEKSKKNTA